MVLANAPRLLLALCATALLLTSPASAPAAKKREKTQCVNTGAAPDTGNVATVRAAVLCLHNQERRARGLAPLRENTRLRRAAQGHSADMVANRFFAHDAPGSDMVDRILKTGYARGAAWSLGENIAYGTGALATAAEIHRAWMRSPGHRANILRRKFREIGIGIALGAPVKYAEGDGATYTTDFGVRR